MRALTPRASHARFLLAGALALAAGCGADEAADGAMDAGAASAGSPALQAGIGGGQAQEADAAATISSTKRDAAAASARDAGAAAGGEPDAGAAGDPDAGGGATPAAPGVRFVGRPDTREDGVTRLAWSGSGILFRFDGTEASVHLDDPGGYFTVVIDGGVAPMLETGGGERDYVVASGLPAGMHTIELYRRTEALFGATRFFDVDVGAGELLTPPPPKQRRLELIGNSITAGYGNEGADAFCPFEARTENHYLTYGAITARNLDAELTTIAWSGKGVIFNYGDDTTDPMPVLYPRALPDDPTSVWDFAAWQPHAVVINLGTNDFSTDGDPSQQEFEGAYRDFLQSLRGHYPDAIIVCLVPTLLSGSDLSTAQGYIEEVVDALTMQGDDRIEVVALQFTQEGAGCDYHPSLSTHASMADALTAELRSILGW